MGNKKEEEERILDPVYYAEVKKRAGKSDTEQVLEAMKEKALKGSPGAGKVFLEAAGALEKRNKVVEDGEVQPDRICEFMLKAYRELREGMYRVDKMSGVIGVLRKELRMDTEQDGTGDNKMGGVGTPGNSSESDKGT